MESKSLKEQTLKKDNTPMYSNTSETVYAKINSNSSHIDQLAIYKGRQKIKDIDTEHIHINLDDGRIFNKMGIHVHEYKAGIRNQNARKPSKKSGDC